MEIRRNEVRSTDGGPAFPSKAKGYRPDDPEPDPLRREIVDLYFTGMTLRDYFAASALSGAMGHFPLDQAKFDKVITARLCYSVADAMLAERAR